MQAIVYKSSAEDGIAIRNKRVPARKRGCVLVRVNYAGLNPVDCKGKHNLSLGRIGDKMSEGLAKWVKWLFIDGSICGFDYSGTVMESGDPMYSVGDKVFGTAWVNFINRRAQWRKSSTLP
jgi:NADPH:quinone reductase-like Zn-dependent oxidoreductase